MKEFSLAFLLFLLGVVLAMNFMLYWALLSYAASALAFAWAIGKAIKRRNEQRLR